MSYSVLGRSNVWTHLRLKYRSLTFVIDLYLSCSFNTYISKFVFFNGNIPLSPRWKALPAVRNLPSFLQKSDIFPVRRNISMI